MATKTKKSVKAARDASGRVIRTKAKKAAPAKRKAPARKKATAAPVSDRPLGKRAQLVADAEAGKLPPAPDFSAATHAPYRKKLTMLKTLVAAKNVRELKAFPINPTSTSPKALARYRDLAVIALQAKGA